MTEDLDRLVRDTVVELAAEAQPRDLLASVQARARRIRVVRGIGYLCAALVAAVSLAVPFLAVHRDRALPPATVDPTGTPSPSHRPTIVPVADLGAPVVLPRGWVVTAAVQAGPDTGDSYVLDRATHRYLRVGYPTAWPAPTGSLVAVTRPDGTGLGLLDLATAAVRWVLQQPATNPQWSPDGNRLLVTLSPDAFAVVDPGTGRVSTHTIDRSAYRCDDACGFSWYPDSRQVVLALTDTSVPHRDAWPDVQRGLQLFDAATGAPGALLPVHGTVAHAGDWSPDRRTVLVTGTAADGTGGRHAEYQLVDTATGQVRGPYPAQPASSWWVDDQQLLSIPARLRVCATDRAGAAGACATLPADFTELAIVIAPS